MSELRCVWRGKRLNRRMVAMIVEAERICPGSYTFGLVQGSYNAGGVAASAGTHDGGGAVDLSIVSHNTTDRLNMQLAMRKVGFAAWIRNPNQGNWGWHIHCIAAGDDDMSAGAAYQVRAYKAGLNGLASRGRDTGPRGYQNVTWESYKAAHKVIEEIDMTVGTDILAVVKRTELAQKAQYTDLVNRIKACQTAVNAWTESRTQAYANFGAEHTDQKINAQSSFNVTHFDPQLEAISVQLKNLSAEVKALAPPA